MLVNTIKYINNNYNNRKLIFKHQTYMKADS